jgi:hypothetical protein
MGEVLKRYWSWVMILSLLIPVLYTCTPVVPRKVAGEPPDRRTVGEKDFDPFGFEDDTLIVTRGELSREGLREAKEAEAGPRKKTGSGASSPRTTYRVQIFMTKYPELASEKAQEAEAIFSERVFVDFEAPYYRVRLGEFDTLEAGEEFLLLVRQSGYQDAWLVKTTIQEGKR